MDPLTLGALFAASNPSVQQGVSNVLGKIPIIGGIFGGSSDAEKALVRRQQQMADMVRRRHEQQRLQAPQLQATAQQMLAFDPLNRAMASMHGPNAAFAPQQMANMVQNPNPFPGIDEWARQQQGGGGPQGPSGQSVVDIIRNARAGKPLGGSGLPGGVKTLEDYRGTDPAVRSQIEEYIRQKKMFDEAEERRRQTIMGGMSQPGPGPAPLGPRAAPQATRRF